MMQIKSVFMLGIGVAFGWMMFQDDDKKEKAITHFKKVMYKLQTGEDYPKPKPVVRPSYKAYYQKKKKKEWSAFECPIFDTREKAVDVFNELCDIGANYGSASICELYAITGEDQLSSWEKNRYGWEWKDMVNVSIVETEDHHWKLNLPKPYLLVN